AWVCSRSLCPWGSYQKTGSPDGVGRGELTAQSVKTLVQKSQHQNPGRISPTRHETKTARKNA
ncbi:hypothetical protein CEXT_66031, partial [Caerostris extrusa]